MTANEWIKYTIKLAVSHVLYALGLLQLWQSIALKRRAVVLMYHRVLTSEERARSASHPAIVVDRETFAKQMAVVKRRFTVISLEEFADRIERKIPFDNSSCLITFDDGWMDNFTNALPILDKQELPAVIFLPVNFIGQNRLFWQEDLVHLLVLSLVTVRREPERESRFRDLLEPIGLGEILDLRNDNPRSCIIDVTSKNRKKLTANMVDATLASLKKELGVENGDFDGTDRFLDWNQVDGMSRQRIEFGGHGAEHCLLSQLSLGEARKDIQLSKEVIDRRLKEAAPTFSYPRGYWTPQVVSLVKESGFRLAFLAKGGRVSCEDDPFTLRRINISQFGTDSTPMFLARIVGLF